MCVCGLVSIRSPSSLSNYRPPGLQVGQQVLEDDTALLWWAGKQLERSKLLRDYVGRNEKTKIVAKLQKKGQGAPGREPVFSAEEQRAMMALAHKKQEEMKVGLSVRELSQLCCPQKWDSQGNEPREQAIIWCGTTR